MVSTTRGARRTGLGVGGSGVGCSVGAGPVLGGLRHVRALGAGGAVPVRVTVLSLPPWPQPTSARHEARSTATGRTSVGRVVPHRGQPTWSRKSSSSWWTTSGCSIWMKCDAAQLDVVGARSSRAAALAMSRAPARMSKVRGDEQRRHRDAAQPHPRVARGAQREVEVPVERGGEELLERHLGELGVAHREHEAGVRQHRDHLRADRQPPGDRAEGLARDRHRRARG